MKGYVVMGFTTIIFLCGFFPLLIIIMSLCARFHSCRIKNIILLCLSIGFYAFSGLYSLVVVSILTVATYFLSLKVSGNRKWLAVGVVSCVLPLLIFKYGSFLSSNMISLVNLLGIHIDVKVMEIITPAGISFITFSMISFLVDIYRKSQPERVSFFEYVSYIFLFPKILEGPIADFDEVNKGLRESTISTQGIYEGVRRFMLGFSKKVILADTLAPFVAETFNGNIHAAGYAWMGLIAYALQLYFDFSGCIDMAIGLGKICGFDLPENFQDPYLAVGIQDFWRRWHITLSVWFKKYIYFPLGGNRTGKWKTYRNLLIIFLLTGIWHGANWTFLAWGLWHGLFMLIERVGFGKILKKIPLFFSHAYTLVVVLIGWILFRADSFRNAITYLQSMFGNASYAEANIIQLINWHLIFLMFIGMLISFKIPDRILGIWGKRIPRFIKDLLIILIFILAIFYMISNGYSPSIYTKF